MWALSCTGENQRPTSEAMGTKCRPTCSTLRTLCILLYISVAHLIHCDAQGRARVFGGPRHLKNRIPKRVAVARYEADMPQSSNTGPYDIGSPFTLPLFDSIPPIPLADTSPPFCINPPSTPQAPSTTLPSPAGDMPSPASYYIPPALPTQSPPPSPTSQGSTPVPSIPGSTPGPPMISGSPPVTILSPPYYYFPAPPSGGLSPPVFLPPVVFPAPMTPPPQNTGPSISLWCVAKPSVPDPIIQEAMNYACGSGADCTSIQPDGTCFEPNTLYAHASYAFNSYWQRTKVAGGTCSFGGTAILVTVDPSYDGCHFVYY